LNLNPDPLIRGTDPRIRIQIHIKMAWIRNKLGNGHILRKTALGTVVVAEL